MKLVDLYTFRIRKDVIDTQLSLLNEQLEANKSIYRFAWHTAYGKPHLVVCTVEDFNKEFGMCSRIRDEAVFSTREDLLNAIRMLKYTTK